MIVCIFWCIFFLIRCLRGNTEPRVIRLLVCFFAVAAILYIDHWLFFSGIVTTAGEWSYGVANLSVYPLYYAYLIALTRAKRNWEVPVLLIPALAAVALFPIGRYTGLMTDTDTFLFVRICFAIQVVWVLVRGYQVLIYTIRRMDDTYSDDRSRLLRPTYISLILFGLTSVVSIVLNIIGRDYFTHQTMVLLPATVMVILLYGLGYVAAHTIIPPETVTDEIHSEDTSTAEEVKVLIHKIDTLMQQQRLYTYPNLTIQDLAVAVGSNRTYVSNAINRTYHISFSQYVANQRVSYAQSILRDTCYTTDKAAVTDAITRSGFTSEQTFYRVFKEITGLTPLAYRKKQ